MSIIGITGLKGSGKDTVGAYLAEQYLYDRMAFAAPLKESAAAALGIEVEAFEELKNDESATVQVRQGRSGLQSITVREFLQRYGTEAHRDIFGADFWVDAAMEKLDDRLGGFKVIRGVRKPAINARVVFTDCRFVNEAKALKQRGGIILRIDRPELEAGDGHASEAGLPDELVDVTLTNDGSIEDLYSLVDHWLGMEGRR